MGRGKSLTREEMGKIIAFKEENLSNREIARRIGRHPSTIDSFIKDPENYGKRRRGRTAMATTERERRLILREASNSTATAREIALKVGSSASVRTVRRVIQHCPHLRRQKLKKKPALQRRHREARYQFCQKMIVDGFNWEKVIFSDEKKFNLDGPDGYRYYFHDLRKEEKYLARRHSALGAVMVWGAISYRGTIDLVIIDGRQDSKKYIELLQEERMKIDEIFDGETWIFQQDNAGFHTARAVKVWFQDNNVQILDWPALSPDLNIIENLWGWLSRRVYSGGKQYHNKNELISALKNTWDEIPLNVIQNMYNSIRKRCVDVVKNCGGHIDY